MKRETIITTRALPHKALWNQQQLKRWLKHSFHIVKQLQFHFAPQQIQIQQVRFYLLFISICSWLQVIDVADNFFISVNFCFTFVSNLLAYITTPRNKGKTKTDWNKKITATYLDCPRTLGGNVHKYYFDDSLYVCYCLSNRKIRNFFTFHFNSLNAFKRGTVNVLQLGWPS